MADIPKFMTLLFCVQTVIAVIMGGIIYAIMRKVGKPVAEFLDGKSQVGGL